MVGGEAFEFERYPENRTGYIPAPRQKSTHGRPCPVTRGKNVLSEPEKSNLSY